MLTENETSGTTRRPDLFARGATIGMHLRVERVQGVGETRNYYVVSDREPRWYTRICWVCGHKHSPPSAQACVYCASPLNERRFLMTARWSAPSKAGFQSLVSNRLTHPLLAAPVVLYRYREQMLAFFDVGEEALLADEPCPLRPTTVLLIAYRLGEAVDFLHSHGVMLSRLGAEHVLLSRDSSVRLFDLDIDRILPGPLVPSDDPTSQQGQDLADIGELLLPLTAIEDVEVIDLLTQVANGAFTDVSTFRRTVYRLAQTTARRSVKSRAAARSGVGMVRLVNEDYHSWRRLPDGSDLFVVCDGMGGHASGEIASRLVTETIVNTVTEGVTAVNAGAVTPDAAKKLLSRALEVANSALLKRSVANTSTRMGTTAVALWVLPKGGAVVSHAGDSRLYRLRRGQIEALTEDTSMVAAMVATGKITKAEARNHPKSNVLISWLGHSEPLEPDTATCDVQPGDRFILCTDGLWGEVEDDVIADLSASQHEPRRVVRWLVQAALDNGGKDNVTVIVADAPAA